MLYNSISSPICLVLSALCFRVLQNRNWQAELGTRQSAALSWMKWLPSLDYNSPSISVYLLREWSCQFSSRSDLKWQSLWLFWRGHLKKNKLSSDMRSVRDLKMNFFSGVISWIATLKSDLSLHNLTFEDATELAMDKPLWRLLVASGATHWHGACRIMMMMINNNNNNSNNNNNKIMNV